MAVSWQVTGDTPDTYEFDGAGNPVVGHTVSFITGDGHRGSVFVPNDHYRTDAVKALIEAKAATVAEVNTLTSDS